MRIALESILTGMRRAKFTTHYRGRKSMPKQYTEEEKLELILRAMEPRVGERAKMRRNLVYMRTALGATLVPVDEIEEDQK